MERCTEHLLGRVRDVEMLHHSPSGGGTELVGRQPWEDSEMGKERPWPGAEWVSPDSKAALQDMRKSPRNDCRCTRFGRNTIGDEAYQSRRLVLPGTLR